MFLSQVRVTGYRGAQEPHLCRFPGRFSVLVGPNGAGKTTLAEAIAMAHLSVFPSSPRRPASLLAPPTNDRSVSVRFDFEGDSDDSPAAMLFDDLRGTPDAVSWNRSLRSSIGFVQPDTLSNCTVEYEEARSRFPLLYLRAERNPLAELGGRDSRLLVELLKHTHARMTVSYTHLTLPTIYSV